MKGRLKEHAHIRGKEHHPLCSRVRFTHCEEEISKSSKQQKDQVVEAIDMMLSNNDADLSNWMAVVDRGGLLHISDDLYRVLLQWNLTFKDISRVEKASKMVSCL